MLGSSSMTRIVLRATWQNVADLTNVLRPFRFHAMHKVFVAIATLALAVLGACGSKPKQPGCKGDKDCKTGQVCASNKCVECRDDTQCPKGKTCKANACVAKAQCEKDTECPLGQVCQAGQCKPCTSDGECGPGGRCEAGACQRPKKCEKNEDCADDEDC